jgi:hypothetical protein
MNLIELLKRALEWDDPYEDMPDYHEVCAHLGLDPSEDPETIKEAIEMELADLNPDGDEGEAEEGVPR